MPYSRNTTGVTFNGILQALTDLVESTDTRPYPRTTQGATANGILDALTDLVAGQVNSPYMRNTDGTTTMDGILDALTDLVRQEDHSPYARNSDDQTTLDGMLDAFTDLVRGEDHSPYTRNTKGTTADGVLEALQDWVQGGAAFQFVNSEAADAVARMTTEPTDAHKAIIDLFFTRLKVGAVNGTDNLTGADTAVLPMKAGVGDQWINLIAAERDPNFNAGTPVFHPLIGAYQTDGSTNRLGTGTNPFSGGINFVRDSACFGVLHFAHWPQVNGSSVGFFNAGGVTMQFPRIDTGITSYRMNQSTADGPAGAVPTSYGFWLANRSGPNAIQFELNGVNLDTGTNASIAIVDGELLMGGIHATSFAPGFWAGCWISNGRTGDQRTDLIAAVREYYEAFLALDFEDITVDVLADITAVPKPGVFNITASRSAMGGSLGTGIEKSVGSVLGADGRVYGIPFDGSAIYIIDPVTREAFGSTLGATIGSGTNKWHSGALSRHNNCIYCFPWDSQDVLKINTQTREATNLTPSGGVNLTGSAKWGTGCEDPLTGLILGAPNTSGTIFQLDPTDDSLIADDMGAGLSPTATQQWAGMYPVADGRIICMPYHGTSVLTIRTTPSRVANTTEFSASDGSTLAGESKWAGGVYSRRTNKIFGCPHKATDFLIIDVLANTWKRDDLGLTFSFPGGGWACGFEGPDGMIYMIPYDAEHVVIIDPVTEVATLNDFGLDLSDGNKWDAVTLTPNGLAVAAPSFSQTVLLLDGFTPNFAHRTLASGYCNNF